MSGGAALQLYRRLLRASRAMPTRARAEFVRRAARREFEHNKSAAAADVPMLLRLAEVQLDAVVEQAAHLKALHERGHLREDCQACSTAEGCSPVHESATMSI